MRKIFSFSLLSFIMLHIAQASNYNYDPNGNLIKDNAENSYQYNAQNQLITFKKQNSATTVHYHYNANGMMDHSLSPSQSRLFIYENKKLSNLILNENKTISFLQQDAIYLEGVNSLMTYYRSTIHNQTQSLILSKDTQILATTNFSPYGLKRVFVNKLDKQDLLTVESLFGYDGQYKDSSSGLIYLRARFYNPELMRFMQRDSYNLLNRYSFTDDDPVNKVDPSGHNSLMGSFFSGLADGLVSGMSIGFCSTAGCGVSNYKQLFSGSTEAWAEFFNPLGALVPLIQHGGNPDDWSHAIGMSLPNMVITGRDILTTYNAYQLRNLVKALNEKVVDSAKGSTKMAQYNKISMKGLFKDVASRRNGVNYIFQPLTDVMRMYDDNVRNYFSKVEYEPARHLAPRLDTWENYVSKKLTKPTSGYTDSPIIFKADKSRKAFMYYVIKTDALLYGINSNSLNQYNMSSNSI